MSRKKVQKATKKLHFHKHILSLVYDYWALHTELRPTLVYKPTEALTTLQPILILIKLKCIWGL